ncbi:hypothetical protein FRC08_017106 [Ceratobasidium sp. 394]|nr:hypothetical protein FRC08_017106 [Ceratobasidium sp. 394]
MPKRHRDTRETFPGSQMAHVVKGSRGAGVGGGIRSRYRVPTPYKSLEPARSLKQINTKGFDENSAEWIAVSSTPAPSHIPKSPAQRALYVSPPKGSYSSSRRAQTGDGMSKSPPMRGGMVKSPSVRSGLSKSGMRRGLSASQSRSSLHASPPQSRSGVRTRAYGSPSRRARFPASSSTRSLPGGRHEAVGTGTASPRSRLPRSAGRPSKSERRPPGYRGSAGKENVPANKGKEDTSGPESPLRIRVANALHFGLGSPGPLIDGHQTAYSHTPNTSAPVSPRRRKQDERDMMCTHAKVLAAEIMNGSAMLGAPTVSARSPTRPRTHNRI